MRKKEKNNRDDGGKEKGKEGVSGSRIIAILMGVK